MINKCTDDAWDRYLKSSLGREPSKQEYEKYNKYKFLMSKTIVIKNDPFFAIRKELAGFVKNGS